MKTIYLISDSTGELGERFTNALLTQFPEDRIALRKFNFVSDEKDLAKVAARLGKDGVLFHTVLSRTLKAAVRRLAERKGLPAFDLTGPPTDFVVRHLKAKPVWDVSVLHKLDADYDKRVNAIEFTIGHDDGAGEGSLEKADVVLVGPSRSSKTPTSMYLAVKGVRVANVPLIPEIGVPEKLARRAGNPKVFALAIAPHKLHEIRRKRAQEFGSSAGDYATLEGIRRELRWIDGVYRRSRWTVIDVTDRAIEETAALILKRIGQRGPA